MTSGDEWVSRNWFKWFQRFGIQSIILLSWGLVVILLEAIFTSVSISLRLRNRERNPFTGSILLVHKTQRKLWWSCRLAVVQVVWFIVPIMYGLNHQKQATFNQNNYFKTKSKIKIRNILSDYLIFINRSYR